MDQKLFKSYGKELMKMEMLKHEKIFREQVYELHRLYRVQKHLMSNMGTTITNHRQDPDIKRVSRNHPQINGHDHHHYNGGSQAVGVGIIDESEIQLTLGPSVYKSKRPNSEETFCLSRGENPPWNLRNNARQMNLGDERMEKHLPWPFQPLSLKLT